VVRTVLGRVLIVTGVACLAWWTLSTVARAAFQREQIVTFNRDLARASSAPSVIVVPRHGVIGRLEIPRLQVAAIVLEGDDEETLAKAVGHLPDTAMPWERGNSALAAHRDTFFRPLRNVRKGDEIRVVTPAGAVIYKVTEIRVTSPDDAQVLAPTPVPSLTLVTCYPFYYIGPAPRRFVVRAERTSTD
jgi:sortase A